MTTRTIVVAGLMIAVTIVLAITGLGYIPVPNATVQAVTIHVPAIIGGILEGPLVGLITGLVFSIDSYFRFRGLPEFIGQPAWVPVLILFVPRLLIGVVAALAYRALRASNQIVALSVSAALGSLANTVLVLGLAVALGLYPIGIFAIAAPQAIFEMVIAAVLTVAIVAAWKNIDTGRGGSSV